MLVNEVFGGGKEQPLGIRGRFWGLFVCEY